jgi:sulfatase maturation enzyme AslB (radical SAM superfamily)
MIINEPGTRCSPCYELEKEKNSFDIISDRVFYLKELKSVPLSTYDQPTTFDLKKVDVRWSNLCNFSCVYCGPEYSSKWENELNIKIDRPMDNKIQQFKNYIFENVEKLEHVYLAGGEPLLMKENLEFLQLLMAKNPEVNIRVNTNLSKVDTQIFDLICQFKNVHWTISVETIEDEYEYIRYGSKWNDFLKNLQIVKKTEQKISFNMLYFLLNYNSLFSCINLLKQFGFHDNSFIIGALTEPAFLDIRHLPTNVLQSSKEQIQLKLNEKSGFLLDNGLQNILKYIDMPFKKDLSNSYKKLEELDKRRNLDSKKIFKDLYKDTNYG